MWKRSRPRAKRNIPESMPASAIATKEKSGWSMIILYGVSHTWLPTARERAPPQTALVCAKLTGRDVGWDFHTVTTEYNKGMKGICGQRI